LNCKYSYPIVHPNSPFCQEKLLNSQKTSGKSKSSVFSNGNAIAIAKLQVGWAIDLLHKLEKLTISNFGFWILDFGLRDLGLLQEI
jgi:hypothetical protein